MWWFLFTNTGHQLAVMAVSKHNWAEMCLFSQASLIWPVRRLEINAEFWLNCHSENLKDRIPTDELSVCFEMKFFSQNNSLSDQLMTPPRRQGRRGVEHQYILQGLSKTIQKLNHTILSTNSFQRWSHCNCAANNRSSSKLTQPPCNSWFGRNPSNMSQLEK